MNLGTLLLYDCSCIIQGGVTIENVTQNREAFDAVLDLVANHFGDKCEVVLFDFSKPKDSSIVSIRNNHVSGRELGGAFGLDTIREGDVVSDSHKYKYISRTTDGRIVSSSYINLYNDDGEAVGAVAINYDVSDLLLAENVLRSLTNGYLNRTNESENVKDARDFLPALINEAQHVIGVAVQNMSREHKLDFIKFLDRHGAFQIKKSGEIVCKYLGISKYLLYNMLGETRIMDNMS